MHESCHSNAFQIFVKIGGQKEKTRLVPNLLRLLLWVSIRENRRDIYCPITMRKPFALLSPFSSPFFPLSPRRDATQEPTERKGRGEERNGKALFSPIHSPIASVAAAAGYKWFMRAVEKVENYVPTPPPLSPSPPINTCSKVWGFARKEEKPRAVFVICMKRKQERIHIQSGRNSGHE